MRIIQFIEGYFWVFLLVGLVLGLSYPVYNDFFMSTLKPLLMIMLLMVFLKTDLIHILKEMKDYKLMTYIVSMYMIIIPVLFYMAVRIFNKELAIGILLLTAMPAGMSSPSLTDIVKGNTALSLSITIITAMTAPFTVPFLFRFVSYNNLSINTLEMFKNLAILVFVPLILSQIIIKIFPETINKGRVIFTSVNIFILFIIVFASIGSQRDVILSNSVSIMWQTGFLYLIFILLHIIGYMIGFNQSKESKTAIAIGAAYMNNGMAIVLAATHYFGPGVLLLMVLSEIPWNTLLAPFRRVIRNL
jgi:predicted Na+-dependent transporter